MTGSEKNHKLIKILVFMLFGLKINVFKPLNEKVPPLSPKLYSGFVNKCALPIF